MIKNGWLYPSTKIYVAKSRIHGLGVFASENIEKGTCFEITPLVDVVLSKAEDLGREFLYDYRFSYITGGKITKLVMALGYGSLYNHSDDPNANWRLNNEINMFEFYSVKDIKAGEEILIYYGDKDYWRARPYTNYA